MPQSSSTTTALSLHWVITAVAVAFAVGTQCSSGDSLTSFLNSRGVAASDALSQLTLPDKALVVKLSESLVLDNVPPPKEANASTFFIPKGLDLETMKEKPFHVYHEDFVQIVGNNPTLTLIADSGTDPLFHEAAVWYPETDEMWFVQNAGAKAAGTGLNKSSIVQKIALSEAMAVSNFTDAVGKVNVETVNSDPPVINPNGGTNYKGNIIFAGEGQGDSIPSALYLVNPVSPYNATVILNNFYGRQFNSLNDVAVHPKTGDIYFTDTLYGVLQDFRPKPVLPRQVYRPVPETGALSAVADQFDLCNGIAISPDGKYAYITDTGAVRGFYGADQGRPASIYRFTIADDGTFEDRKLFAYVHSAIPDGIHCDSNGNVYAGCGDGVHVWNCSGAFLGKIFTGELVANFQFAGKGRMVILAETKLFYATLGAEGAPLT
ncbi:calcium-dependent phosphotriesterase [Sarocladium strictum]